MHNTSWLRPDVRAHVVRSLQAERARRRLYDFVRIGWSVLEPQRAFVPNWHAEAVCDHIQWMFEDWRQKQSNPDFPQRVQNLLINIPPGTAKSRIVSVYAPAWIWLHYPSFRFLCISANPDVANRDALLCRQLLESDWYREWFTPPWGLSEDQYAKSNYSNTAGGSHIGKGITAKIIGQRVDAIIVDDPHDAKEVHSDPLRKEVLHAWDQAVGNRVNDLRSSLRIGIMQRLHELDWSGHVLARGGWAHLCLPMEFDPARKCKTPFGWEDPRTVAGEVLHPELFPPSVLASERVRLGSAGYEGQMNQQPAPADGIMFKRDWIRYYDVLPDKLDWTLISVDAAFAKTDTGSRVGMLVIAGKGPHRYVVDNRTRAMDIVNTCDEIMKLRQEYPQATRILVEKAANGHAIVRLLETKVAGLISIQPEGGKVSRAQSILPEVESGNLLVPKGAPWLDGFLHELCTFPNSQHDDQVDALSQALNHMRADSNTRRAIMLSSW